MAAVAYCKLVRRLVTAGAIGAMAMATTAAAADPAAPGCPAAEARQFDFWIGRWDVFAKARPDTKVADSLIEAVYGGCGVRENWRPAGGGATGGSLSTFVPARNSWRQFWIDANGSAVDFTGGWTGSTMVLTGAWPQPGHPTQITRMTYAPLADGAVQQALDTSDDDGRTWAPSIVLIYRRATDSH